MLAFYHHDRRSKQKLERLPENKESEHPISLSLLILQSKLVEGFEPSQTLLQRVPHASQADEPKIIQAGIEPATRDLRPCSTIELLNQDVFPSVRSHSFLRRLSNTYPLLVYRSSPDNQAYGLYLSGISLSYATSL